MKSLRLVRMVTASVSLVAVTFFFLDVNALLPKEILSVVLSLQLAPSIAKLFAVVGWSAFGVVIVLILTLLFGRVYCSFLCPLGTLQDIAIWLKKRKFKHRSFPYRKPMFLQHYAVTGLTVVGILFGSMVLLNLLEPFSNYGRIVSNVLRPLYYLANNAVAAVSSLLGHSIVFAIPFDGFILSSFGFAVLFSAFILWLAYAHGRLFCNLLCPVGGVLSLLARFSAFKITIQSDNCIDCGLCTRVCRAECIKSEDRRIDSAACVGCFDCIGSCPTSGMSFQWKKTTPAAAEQHHPERREMLRSSAVLLFAPMGASKSDTIVKSKLPVVPPGGQGLEHFTAHCTACHLCVSACPTSVLVPSLFEYGLAGFEQPKMDFGINYCNYDCMRCADVCPTGALLPLTKESKKTAQIGKATFLKEECIVETKKTDCGACSEHCPTKAVSMKPYGKLFLPNVEAEYCVGCGACEHACPTRPTRAIFVESNVVHEVAKIRPMKQTAPVQATPTDFPF